MATVEEALENICKRLDALESKTKKEETKVAESVTKPFSMAGSFDVGDSMRALSIKKQVVASNGLFNDGSIDATAHANKKTVVWDTTNSCWKFYAVYFSDE